MHFKKTGYSLFIALLTVSIMVGCSHTWSNFSQYPGFSEYYAHYPRTSEAATPQEQRLLSQFRPRLFVAKSSEGPISFYQDYIAQGSLQTADGTLISKQANSQLLNQFKTDPSVVFIHKPHPGPVTPEAFARIDYDEHPALERLSFLTYHFVFRTSGIAVGLPWWQELLLPVIGNPDDWHQLDHYTAATVVLNASQRPIALILQQHNHERSYVLGVDLPYPAADNRIKLIAARRSNELYPWHPGTEQHRVVRFMSPETLPYLVTGKKKPWLAGYDVTVAEREVDYKLDFIPASDAFYSFTGFLGERRRMAGRDGPPGADYNTLPPFKRPLIQLVAFNWRENDRNQMQALLAFSSNPHVGQAPFANLLSQFKNKIIRAETVIANFNN